MEKEKQHNHMTKEEKITELFKQLDELFDTEDEVTSE